MPDNTETKPRRDIGTFTPVLDVLARKYGPLTALIYGYIDRRAQGVDKVCRASRETIADNLGLNVRTLKSHIDKLITDGYVIAVARKRHVPCHYKPTGKAEAENIRTEGGRINIPLLEGNLFPYGGENNSPNDSIDDLNAGANDTKNGATSAPPPYPRNLRAGRQFDATTLANRQEISQLRKHPAIVAYKRVTNYYPRSIEGTKQLIEWIGNNPDIEKMEKDFAEWVDAKGGNPQKIIWVKNGYLGNWYYEAENYIAGRGVIG